MTARSQNAEDEDLVDRAARALVEQQWPVVVTLKRPIEFGSEHVSSLSFRRGRMGDLRGMTLSQMPSVDQLLLIASRMCGQPVAVLERLEDEDGVEVMALALAFFMRCLGAGRTR